MATGIPKNGKDKKRYQQAKKCGIILKILFAVEWWRRVEGDAYAD